MGHLRKRVGVFPPSELEARKSTFAGLSGIFPVAFEPFNPASSFVPDACILLGGNPPAGPQLDVPCYLWEGNAAGLSLGSAQVKFSSWPELHYAIRGQRLAEATPREIGFLTAEGNDIVVAEIGDRPVWTVRRLVHRVAVEPPRLGDGEALFAHFDPKRWLGLLPLMHFLRSVTRDVGWEEPPLRACFLLDDPNLHAFTYGHLDFRQIARGAREHNYHVVFATIPADGWYVKPGVARLFASESDYISLTTHGVNHTLDELGRVNGNILRLLALGLQRLERFERKTGLDVSRIMVPPHEAWSNAISDAMLKLGYEGATASTEHVARRNKKDGWPQHWGLGPVSWVGGGFPIIPRFPFAGAAAATGIRLAAYLGQPVILKGHHWDCSCGIDVLRQRAAVLNELGARWGDLKSIFRTNYRTRIDGDVLKIQMCSRQVQVEIPDCVRSISIERPWLEDSDQEPLMCTSVTKTGLCRSACASDLIDVIPGTTVNVSALPKDQIDYRAVLGDGPRVWPIVRRVLVEGRDRVRRLLGV